jgi:FtsZ-binding cell division protein ZapB
MRLYEITDEYRSLLERYSDPDATQEDLDAIAEQLAGKDAEWQEKARAVYAYMREETAAADALTDEIMRLQKLQKQHAKAAERMHDYLEREMIRLELGTQDLGICKMRIQKSAPFVVLATDDLEQIDAQYIRVIPEKREIDKRAIADDLRAGAELPYARLEQSKYIRFQ